MTIPRYSTVCNFMMLLIMRGIFVCMFVHTGLKQYVTVGPCSKHGGDQPNGLDLFAIQKWKAWHSQEKQNVALCMKEYIELAQRMSKY